MTKKEFDAFHLKKLGETLKYWRKKNKISLYDLSRAMSINYHALKNIEEGNECVQIKILLRYIWFIQWQGGFDVFKVYTSLCNIGNGRSMDIDIDEVKREINEIIKSEEPKGLKRQKIEWKYFFD